MDPLSEEDVEDELDSENLGTLQRNAYSDAEIILEPKPEGAGDGCDLDKAPLLRFASMKPDAPSTGAAALDSGASGEGLDEGDGIREVLRDVRSKVKVISPIILKKLVDNGNKRRLGEGLAGRILGLERKPNLSPQILEKINEIEANSHR